MNLIERLSVEVLPDRIVMVEEDGIEWIGVGGVENAIDPPTMVLELIACDRSPVVLDASDPRVHKSAVSSGHPAFTREKV